MTYAYEFGLLDAFAASGPPLPLKLNDVYKFLCVARLKKVMLLAPLSGEGSAGKIVVLVSFSLTLSPRL